MYSFWMIIVIKIWNDKCFIGCKCCWLLGCYSSRIKYEDHLNEAEQKNTAAEFKLESIIFSQQTNFQKVENLYFIMLLCVLLLIIFPRIVSATKQHSYSFTFRKCRKLLKENSMDFHLKFILLANLCYNRRCHCVYIIHLVIFG